MSDTMASPTIMVICCLKRPFHHQLLAVLAITVQLIVLVEQSAGQHQRVFLSHAAKEKGAVCLDGSPGAYYFKSGSGTGSNKFFIFHQGGGWCENLDDCLGRSKTDLGSSKDYPPTITIDTGYWSEDPAVNPLMHNWNSLYMRYCDGASFSGNNESAAVYQGVRLFSRGSRIRQAIFDDISEMLSNATDVVISGCSAGGLATYLHTDQWCDDIHAINPETKCVGMPDSGFFLDYQKTENSVAQQSQLSLSSSSVSSNIRIGQRKLKTIPGDYHRGLKWVYQFSNATGGINTDCVAASQSGEEDDWKCMFAEHVSPFIHTPIFALQSEYDSWQTKFVLPIEDDTDINILGINITSRLQANLFHVHPESGGFVDSCHHHCGSWGQIIIDGDNVAQAFSKWYTGLDDIHEKNSSKRNRKRVWSQMQTYPCEACCHPRSSNRPNTVSK